MVERDVVAAALDRLRTANLLHHAADVRLTRVGAADAAMVIVALTAPSATVRLVEHALAGLPHECVIDSRFDHRGPRRSTASRDGRDWLIGTRSDVSWINDNVQPGFTITSAIPPRYDAYATLAIGEDEASRRAIEALLLALLEKHSATRSWWLGYLDTGAHDVVFDDVQKVIAYSEWSYVLVQAGPTQAGSWREDSDWRGRLPDLLFPADRSWLVSMLWDDDWRCIGGPADLIDAVVAEPSLTARAVNTHENATPPGHIAL